MPDNRKDLQVRLRQIETETVALRQLDAKETQLAQIKADAQASASGRTAEQEAALQARIDEWERDFAEWCQCRRRDH